MIPATPCAPPYCTTTSTLTFPSDPPWITSSAASRPIISTVPLDAIPRERIGSCARRPSGKVEAEAEAEALKYVVAALGTGAVVLVFPEVPEVPAVELVVLAGTVSGLGTSVYDAAVILMRWRGIR
jgi:hypothetical protein